ncbi:uncharacterized protein LOC134655322, partial [Cydia amplana]|uniref:uncharacterized protein LOC134655322 n=1 Tax=Cydia amplana TaxID=1869771 RepID=UPI002FE6464B
KLLIKGFRGSYSSIFQQEVTVDPEEEARAERKRRQRQAQEEFRLKQLMRQKTDESSELKNGSSIDRLLMDIPSQDIVVRESGKRKTPPPEGSTKRRGGIGLDMAD